MANVFFNLPAPAGNGAGAAVDVSSMGALKTLTIARTGHVFQPFVTIEFSCEIGAPTVWTPLKTFQSASQQSFDIACMWMRAVVSNFKGGIAPNCDVGGQDDGTSAANLPVTAGDGTGAPVDVSGLLNFKTIQVASSFRGAVNVEISEDGVDYETIASFTNNGGQKTMLFAAHWMRVVRASVPGVAPGLPVVNVGATSGSGASGGGGDTAQNVLTFRPGSGFTGPVVFDDFDELYAQLVDLRTATDIHDSGIYTIVFDDQDGALEIPGETYDMDRTVWVGVRWWRNSADVTSGYQVDVECQDGCAVTNLARVDGIALTTVSADPVISVADNQTLSAEGTTFATAGTDPLINLASGASLRLCDQSRAKVGSVGGGAEAAVTVFLDGAQSTLESNALVTGALYTVVQGNASSRVLWPMGVTMTLIMACGAGVYDNPAASGNPNTIVTAALGTLLVSTSAGALYTNTNGTTGWASTINIAAMSINNLTVNVDFNGDGTNDLFQTRFSGWIARTGPVTPAALPAGRTDDYDPPPGIGTGNRIRQATNAANSDLSGIVPIGVNGAEFYLVNLGTGTLTLLHEDLNSVPANRFALAGAANRVIAVNGIVIITYDATLARWLCIG